jgi:hypothetical protein
MRCASRERGRAFRALGRQRAAELASTRHRRARVMEGRVPTSRWDPEGMRRNIGPVKATNMHYPSWVTHPTVLTGWE